MLRNPLVLAGAGLPEGVVLDQPVEMIDLFATLLELAEAEVRHTHFGRSLLPVVEDPSVEHRAFACADGGFRTSDAHLLETAGWIYEKKARLQRERPELVGLASVLRTPTLTYVYRRYESDELYDRVGDPAETTNLVDEPEHADRARELRDLLLDWQMETADVIPWDADPRFPDIPHGWR